MTERDTLASLLDVAEAIVKERLARYVVTEKGDSPGHPFRGNQWTGGTRRAGIEGGDSGAAAFSDEDRARKISVAKDAAKELGFNPADVVIGGPGRKFKVGGEEMEAGAEFVAATGKIHVYDGVLKDSDESFIKGVVAHEINHAKFMEVHEQYDAEQTSLRFNKHKLDGDGELLPKYRKEYPTYNALHKYIDGDKAETLGKEDGVTGYSKAYWKGRNIKGSKFKLAIDETLAEVSYLKVRGNDAGVSKSWNDLNSAIDTHYNRLKKKK